MKRLTAILLALLYISTTSGIVVNMHYCMGKVAEVELGASQKASCGTCGMENQGCCHDDLLVLKLSEKHNYTAASFVMPSLDPVQPVPVDHHQAQLVSDKSITRPINHSPPLTVPKNVLYCVYRI